VRHDEKALLKDIALIRRAVRAGSPVPENVRCAIPVGLERILDESTNAREVVRAAGVLVDMDWANLRDEGRALQAPDGIN
jgi:hypothetical protein